MARVHHWWTVLPSIMHNSCLALHVSLQVTISRGACSARQERKAGAVCDAGDAGGRAELVYVDYVCDEGLMTLWREGPDLWEIGCAWLGGLGQCTSVHVPHHLVVDAVNSHSITGSEGSSHLVH